MSSQLKLVLHVLLIFTFCAFMPSMDLTKMETNLSLAPQRNSALYSNNLIFPYIFGIFEFLQPWLPNKFYRNITLSQKCPSKLFGIIKCQAFRWKYGLLALLRLIFSYFGARNTLSDHCVPSQCEYYDLYGLVQWVSAGTREANTNPWLLWRVA